MENFWLLADAIWYNMLLISVNNCNSEKMILQSFFLVATTLFLQLPNRKNVLPHVDQLSLCGMLPYHKEIKSFKNLQTSK